MIRFIIIHERVENERTEKKGKPNTRLILAALVNSRFHFYGHKNEVFNHFFFRVPSLSIFTTILIAWYSVFR